MKDINLELLDLLGKGYVIDHCISLFKKESREKILNNYVTDALYCIANMIKFRCGGEGKAIMKRFSEIAYPVANSKNKNTEETSDEIIDKIKKKLGG